jgi:hypothetical protein
MYNTKYSSFTATCFVIRKPSPESAQWYILNLKNRINLHLKKFNISYWFHSNVCTMYVTWKHNVYCCNSTCLIRTCLAVAYKHLLLKFWYLFDLDPVWCDYWCNVVFCSLVRVNKASLLSHRACCYIYFIQNQLMHSFLTQNYIHI